MANDSLRTLMSQLQFQRMQRNQMRRSSGNSMSSMLSMINNIGRGQEKTVEAIARNASNYNDIDSINVAQEKIREIGKNAPFTYKGVIGEYANSLDLKKKQIQADEDYKNEYEDLASALEGISPKGGEYSSQIGDVLATMDKNHEINQESVSEKVHDIVGDRIADLKKQTAAQMYALSMDADQSTPGVIDAPENATQMQRAQIEGLNTLWQASQVTGNNDPFRKRFESVATSPSERSQIYSQAHTESLVKVNNDMRNEMEDVVAAGVRPTYDSAVSVLQKTVYPGKSEGKKDIMNSILPPFSSFTESGVFSYNKFIDSVGEGIALLADATDPKDVRKILGLGKEEVVTDKDGKLLPKHVIGLAHGFIDDDSIDFNPFDSDKEKQLAMKKLLESYTMTLDYKRGLEEPVVDNSKYSKYGLY
jgi:hypothetical protein